MASIAINIVNGGGAGLISGTRIRFTGYPLASTDIEHTLDVVPDMTVDDENGQLFIFNQRGQQIFFISNAQVAQITDFGGSPVTYADVRELADDLYASFA